MADRFAQGFHKSCNCVPPGDIPDVGALRSRYVRLGVKKKNMIKNVTRESTESISCNDVS